MTGTWAQELTDERDTFRRGLAAHGFNGDRDTLIGPLRWRSSSTQGAKTATIEVALTDAFPFGPPQVRILDAGMPLELTFHREFDGSLCLWSSNVPVDNAPWRSPSQLLLRVAAWLRQTDACWPNDTDCDLERYLPSDPRLLLYDRDRLATVKGCVRTQATANGLRVTISDEPQRPPSRPVPRKRRRAQDRGGGGPKIGRRHRGLAWIADVGQLDRPVQDGSSLCQALGADARHLIWLISVGVIEFVVLRYRRHGADGVLALAVRPAPSQTPPIEVRSCEGADTSLTTRMLRAGPAATKLADRRVAVVGTGAIGSFVADLLFRHGIRQLTMLDPQLLLPGNLVRHLAGESLVGFPKVHAVKARLAALGFDTTSVDGTVDRLATPQQAMKLLRDHHLVVDATADARATALFTRASSCIATPVLSVCLQREGAIARVDRFPLRGAERHLEAVLANPQPGETHEHGCDAPVSPTPPSAVVAASELVCRAAIDELTYDCKMPATLIEVYEPQEAPFDVRGLMTSEPQERDGGGLPT
ncbi:molybdopterin/thiamine biosynthesis adenylyltransferase [Micromonospora profundi]|uniref:ThiF family adenylyltransferase n=1 Tax=Micromonospora profundi TaxID=1420889 RepID=UPI00143BC718|nr:ThiF family adenylyltransferase [Micromonospora profundi]NJC13053.1 molybdopterin/thiamine biosynthesis adenylyltransferase [Micromonospora profundi]